MEIEYRAWHKELKEMYYSVQFLYDWGYVIDDLRNISLHEINGGLGGTCFGELLLDKEFVVMRSSGYRDVNHKKVYNHDYCKFFHNGWKYCVINWYKGGFVAVLLSETDESTPKVIPFFYLSCVPDIGLEMTEQFEVVGNIYQDCEKIWGYYKIVEEDEINVQK